MKEELESYIESYTKQQSRIKHEITIAQKLQFTTEERKLQNDYNWINEIIELLEILSNSQSRNNHV